MGENWFSLSPKLAARGYCVFALTYGVDSRAPEFGGVIPVEQSALELKAFVRKVRRATGARKVDLVGHSEGTFMPEYWLKFLGGANKVHTYVAMTPLYQGTTLGGLSMLRDAAPTLAAPLIKLVAGFCGSCPEFLAGSDMVKKLNSDGGPAVPGHPLHDDHQPLRRAGPAIHQRLPRRPQRHQLHPSGRLPERPLRARRPGPRPGRRPARLQRPRPEARPAGLLRRPATPVRRVIA